MLLLHFFSFAKITQVKSRLKDDGIKNKKNKLMFSDFKMLMPKKNLVAIYEHLFTEGVIVAMKDTHAPKHPELEKVPNLHVSDYVEQSIPIVTFPDKELVISKLSCYLLNFIS